MIKTTRMLGICAGIGLILLLIPLTSHAVQTTASVTILPGQTVQTNSKATPKEDSATPTQTIRLQKIINQEVTTPSGDSKAQTQGINGAHFIFYDVTSLYQKIQKEDAQHKTSSADQQLNTLLTRAEKQSVQDLPIAFQGTTTSQDGQAGVLVFQAPADAAKPHAYYVVNDQNPKGVATSSAATLITPVTDDKGDLKNIVSLFPKTTAPKKETLPIVSTGISKSWLSQVHHFLITLLGG